MKRLMVDFYWEKKQFEKWLWTNASVDRRKSKIFWEDEKPYCTLPDLGSFVLEWEGWLARAELENRNACRECGVEVNFGKISVNGV